jgi:hypothetical protein
MMEVISVYEMLVTTYKTAQCHNPEDHDSDFYCHKNLMFNITY